MNKNFYAKFFEKAFLQEVYRKTIESSDFKTCKITIFAKLFESSKQNYGTELST